jgi:thioredoxin-like negative regulator of GroEL
VTRAWTLLAVIAFAAGCVTPYGQGQRALSQGRYSQAATYFTQALAEDPERSDAVLGLGIAQYKQALFPDAADTLARAVAERPIDPTSRLYLALSYIQQGDAARAEEQLTTLRDLKIDSRLGRQVGRALELLRDEPLSEPIRGFMAGSLETEAELWREAQEARLEAQRPFYYAPAPYPCVFVRRGGRLFCI